MTVMSSGDHSYNLLMAAFPSAPEPPFESAEMQELVWGRRWGCATDVVDPAKYLSSTRTIMPSPSTAWP